jgi:hypothetical protein
MASVLEISPGLQRSFNVFGPCPDTEREGAGDNVFAAIKSPLNTMLTDIMDQDPHQQHTREVESPATHSLRTTATTVRLSNGADRGEVQLIPILFLLNVCDF